MAKNLVLIVLGAFAIYGAVMVDLNVLRENQKNAILAKVEVKKLPLLKETEAIKKKNEPKKPKKLGAEY